MNEEKWYENIQAGDMIVPDPEWNKSERNRKLHNPTRVEAVGQWNGQTGFKFTVKTTRGFSVDLDAGWFLGKHQ